MNQFKIKSSELADKLAVLGKAMGNKSMPMLECVHIQPNGKNKVQLTTTNLDITISTSLIVRGGIDEPTLIEFDWLKKVCNACNGASTITITYNTSNKEINAKTIDAVINGKLSDGEQDYPAMGNNEYENSVTIDSTILAGAIDTVKFACCKDAGRLIMTGVCLSRENENELNVVATDGRMLAWNVVYTEEAIKGELGIVLPLLLCDVIKQLYGAMVVQYSSDKVLISCGPYLVGANLIEGRYPNFKSVVPPLDKMNHVTLSRYALMQALKRASAFGNSTSGLVCIMVKDKNVSVIGDDELTDVQTELPCTKVGDDINIGLCGEFMLKELANLSGDAVRLYYTIPNMPAIMVGAEDTLKELQMPMMLDDRANTPLERAINALKEEPTKEQEQTEEHTEEEPSEEEPSEDDWEDTIEELDENESEDYDSVIEVNGTIVAEVSHGTIIEE